MNDKRVLTFGTFDLLHLGHIKLLKRCADLGKVTVGLGTDSYQKIYKRVPAQSYEMRAAVLKELPWVDKIVRREQVDTRGLIPYVEPDYLAVGSDWINLPYLEASGISVEYLEQHEITLVFFPRTLYVSTSDTIADILNRQGGEVQGS